jgi:hypothetical protein
MSADLEDIVALADGRAEIVNETRGAPSLVRDCLAAELGASAGAASAGRSRAFVGRMPRARLAPRRLCSLGSVRSQGAREHPSAAVAAFRSVAPRNNSKIKL